MVHMLHVDSMSDKLTHVTDAASSPLSMRKINVMKKGHLFAQANSSYICQKCPLLDAPVSVCNILSCISNIIS